MTQERPVTWAQAVQRADEVAALGHHPADSWDGRAIRGVLAVTLLGLAKRQERSVEEVDIGSVLWHLDQGPATVYELGGELGAASEDAEPGKAAVEWAWLVRRWPTAPALANSGGMPRGIGRGSPLPAVDVATGWACSAVQTALAAERPAGLTPRTRVRVVAGEDRGRSGEVVAPAWLMDDEHRTVLPGPPSGYEVVLTVSGQESEPGRLAMSTIGGEIQIEVPGPHGEHVIVRTDDLEPEEHEPATQPSSP
ncbi:hypothetical protein OG285_31805 [Streptomyces sp. NBC_01471]|uniref:hypothetical protein n=1 Tax=Streptomyces sp. NBC_01471 TaxID=2903879 RepID=UPI00324D3F92